MSKSKKKPAKAASTDDPATQATKQNEITKTAADETPATETSNAKTTENPSAGKKPKAKRPHRWRRRIKVAVWTIVVLFCLFRLAISLALPSVLRKVAGYYNLDCTYDRCSLSFFGGNVSIWHLRFLPKDHLRTGAAPVLTTEYIQGTIDPIKLLTGKLYVWRAEVDGADLSIERMADGHIPVLEDILAARSKSAAKTQTAQNIDLQPPLKLEALRVEHLTAHVRDLSVSPVVDTTLQLGVRVSDVGSNQRPMRFEVDLAIDGVLDSLHISGERRGGASNLDADVAIVMQGLKLKPAAGYLRPLGIVPVGNAVTIKMHGHVNATASTQPTTAPWMTATLAMRDFSVQADGQEAVACDSVQIPVPYADATSLKLGKIVVQGVRFNGQRLANGDLRFAGLDLVKAPPSAATTQPLPPAAISPATTQPAAPMHVTCDGFQLLDAKFNFEDQAVSPPGKFALILDELSTKQLSLNARDPKSTIDLSAVFHLPGLAHRVQFDGTVHPFAPDKTAEISIKASGIRPDLLKPYLDAAGIESLYEDGNFQCSGVCEASQGAAGQWMLNAQLFDLKLSDAQPLLTLDQVKLKGLTYTPQNLLRIQSMEIDGPSLVARREPGGDWSGLGFRIAPHAKATKAKPPVVAVSTSTPPAAAPFQFPALQIDKFSWKNIQLDLDDQTMQPARHLVLGDAGIELEHFHLDLNSDKPDPPGHLKLYLAAEKLVHKLTLEGTLSPQPHGLSVELNLDGQGLSGQWIAPYLSSLGIVPTLRDGSISADVSAKIIKTPTGGITASVAVEKLRYADGANQLASIGSLRLDEASLIGGELTLGNLDLEQPKFQIARDSDGSFEIAGVRLHTPTATHQESPAAPATSQPAVSQVESQPPAMNLKKLHIQDAEIVWSDRAVSPEVETSLITSVDLQNFVMGRHDVPARLNLLVRIPGSLEQLRIIGDVQAAPDAQSAKLAIEAQGIKAGAVAAYLPPGMRLSVTDGRLKLAIDAMISNNPAGGQSAVLKVNDFGWQDGAQPPLISFDNFTLAAPRLDPAGGHIALDEISLTGLQTQLRLLPDGSIDLLGLMISPTPAVAPVAAPAPAAAPAKPAPAGNAAPVTAQQVLAEAHKTLPLITLEKLNLQLRHVAMTDARHAGAAPLAIEDLLLRNTQPIRLFGPDAANLPPVNLDLTGRIDPLINQLHIQAAASPCAQQPDLTVDLTASGIHGDGVTKLMPELAAKIDGHEMQNGRLQAHLKTTLTVHRRGSAQLDLSQGFDLNLLLKGTEFRASPDGPVLLGLDELRTEGVQVRPQQQSIRIKSIELTKPVGSAVIDRDGLHVVGLIIKIPGLAAELPTSQPTSQPAATQAADVAMASPDVSSQPSTRPSMVAMAPGPVVAAARPATEPASVKPTQLISIGRVLISGLDFQLEDRSVTPALVVPLAGLDVDVRGLSNWLAYADIPLRFSVLVNSGKVTLPKVQQGAGIPGAIGDIASLLGGRKTPSKPPEFEQRNLFSEVSLTGNLRLYPKTTGYIKASLDGLELSAFASEAKARANVTIGGGTLDTSTSLRFPGDGSADVHAKIAATDLRLSEPPKGPLQRLLGLPAPIDMALKVMETPDGAITIPVNVTEKDGKIEGIASSIVGAVGGVMGAAIVSAPIKAMQGVTSLVGINLNFGRHKPPPPATILFPAGYAGLEPSAATTLAGVIDALRSDRHLVLTIRHELGGGDITVAAGRANPTTPQATALAYRLHAREQELLHLRADLAGQTRALLSSGDDQTAGASIDRLRDVDREIAQTDDALDHVYDLLRPGADLQSARRTRAAAIEIGQQRLLSIQQSLQNAGIPDLDQRVRLVPSQFNPTDAPDGGKITITFALSSK